MMKHILCVLAFLAALALHASPLTDSIVFPADWQGARLALVKKLPQAVILKLAGKPTDFTSSGRITFDTPKGVRVIMVAPRWSNPTPYAIRQENTGDGNRAVMEYPLAMFRRLTPNYGWGAGHYVYLEAEDDAQPGNLVIAIEHNGDILKKHTIQLDILPRLVPPARPLRNFLMGIAALTSAVTHEQNTDIFKRSAAFWQSLSPKPYIRIGWPSVQAPAENIHYLAENFTVDLGCHACRDITFKCGGTRFEDLGFSVGGKVTRPGVPPMLDDKGKPVPASICPQYLLKDPDNLFHDQYIPRTIQFYQDLYNGKLSGVHLDYEPFIQYGTCDDCMKAFAKYANLAAVPTRDDVADGKPLNAKWREYKTDLQRKVLDKIIDAIHRHFPGLPFNFCGSTPAPRKVVVNSWDGVDTNGLEEKISSFQPMNYCCGIQYYNSLQKQLAAINGKSKINSWVDPSEESIRFFARYTPKGIQQNLLATFALGADGFTLYPSDALDGRYFTILNNTVRAIQPVEDFYATKPQNDKLRWRAANSTTYTLKDLDGKEHTVDDPDFSQFIRAHLHEKDGECLITLINYSKQVDACLELAVPSYNGNGTVADILHNAAFHDVTPTMVKRGFLARVPADDAIVIKIGKNTATASAETQSALAESLKNTADKASAAAAFKPQANADRAAEWLLKDGKITFRLTNGKQWILIDPQGNATVRYWMNGPKHPATGSETTFGGIFFYSDDKAQRPFTLDACDLSNAASATFSHVIPADQGFGAENPLAGLKITKTITLENPKEPEAGTLDIDVTFTNASDRNISFGFRMQQLPARGDIKDGAPKASFAHAPVPQEVSLKNGTAIPWPNAANAAIAPDNLDVTLAARWYTYTFSQPDAVGIYSWRNAVINTVEPLFPQITLKPGETKTYRTTAAFRLR